jgi:hypothetical protein
VRLGFDSKKPFKNGHAKSEISGHAELEYPGFYMKHSKFTDT